MGRRFTDGTSHVHWRRYFRSNSLKTKVSICSLLKYTLRYSPFFFILLPSFCYCAAIITDRFQLVYRRRPLLFYYLISSSLDDDEITE